MVDPAAAFAFMDNARQVYRWLPVEALVLACVAVQMATGLLLARRLPGSTPGARATRISAYYLLFFLAVHLGAVFWGRHGLQLDTNIHFAAAGLHAWPSAAFFVPYYFLAVLAVFVHLGLAAGRYLSKGKRAAPLLAGAVGAVLSALIVAAMAGVGNGLQIPAAYLRAVA
ncbi:hypothetical protein [Massilia consociata]|uniref:hypothetical protein n=1 Tax=Massilia consociata TaxID=760117 RepID=UPI0036D20B7C